MKFGLAKVPLCLFWLLLLSVPQVLAKDQYYFNHASQNSSFNSQQAILLSLIEDSQTEQKRIELQLSLARLYKLFNRADLLTPLLDKLEEQNIVTQNTLLSAQWHLLSGYSLYYSGQYTQANQAFELSISILDSLPSAGEQEDSLIYFKSVVKMYTGLNLVMLQRYVEGLEIVNAVNKLATSKDWEILSARSHYFLADINYQLKNYEQALSYYALARQKYPKEAKLFIAEAVMGEAQMINIVGERTKAFSLLTESLDVFNNLEDQSSLAYGYLLMSYFHSKDENHSEALEWIAKSVSLQEQMGNISDIANSYVHYSAILNENNQLRLALEYAEKSASLAAQTDDLSGQWDANNNYAQLLNKSGDYKLAFDYMYKAERALLAKARLDLTSQVAQLTSNFNLTKEQMKSQFLDEKNTLLQAQIKQQMQQQEKQHLALIGLLVLIFIILGFMFVVFQLYRKNRLLATKDPLTGVHNRRSILELGQQAFETSSRYRHDLTVLMLDIDDFKAINDTHGHSEGDKVLFFLANICVQELRTTDYLGRVGGEEFLFVLPNSSEKDGLKLATRLCSKIQELAKRSDLKAKNVTVSIGLASDHESCNDFLALANLADMALYQAKNSGKNQVQEFTIDMTFNNQSA